MISLRHLASNFNLVSAPKIEIYFSYETPIAFYYKGKLTIRENDWSSTTGKHLNSISTDKSIRVDGSFFKEELKKALSGGLA